MIIRNYNEEVYARKFANLGEMDKILEDIIFQSWMKKKQKA